MNYLEGWFIQEGDSHTEYTGPDGSYDDDGYGKLYSFTLFYVIQSNPNCKSLCLSRFDKNNQRHNPCAPGLLFIEVM